MGEAGSGAAMYFERQRLQQCLLHTVNNLFQAQVCTAGELDDIANQLAPGRPPLFHPHRTLFLGNWCVNVLEVALRRHGKELQWVDLRDLSFPALDLRTCWGLVVNVKGQGALARILGGRHWFAVKRIGGRWFVLDSLLDGPRTVTSLVVAAVPGALPPAAAAAAVNPDLPGGPRVGPSACDQGAAQTQTGAALEELALKSFLSQSVQLRDGKVFVVAESKLASHPLPDAPPDGASVREGPCNS